VEGERTSNKKKEKKGDLGPGGTIVDAIDRPIFAAKLSRAVKYTTGINQKVLQWEKEEGGGGKKGLLLRFRNLFIIVCIRPVEAGKKEKGERNFPTSSSLGILMQCHTLISGWVMQRSQGGGKKEKERKKLCIEASWLQTGVTI